VEASERTVPKCPKPDGVHGLSRRVDREVFQPRSLLTSWLGIWNSTSGCAPETIDLTHPAGQWVPSRENLGHQTFIPTLNRPQVAEGRRGYGGSNKAVSVERDSVRKEQLLEPLALFE